MGQSLIPGSPVKADTQDPLETTSINEDTHDQVSQIYSLNETSLPMLFSISLPIILLTHEYVSSHP